jgi:hypothetical protein
MASIAGDVCPHCEQELNFHFGLIKACTITRRHRGHEMFLTKQAVVSNWQYNLAARALLVTWVGFALVVIGSPQAAAWVGQQLQLPLRTFKDQAVLALAGMIPGVLAAVPFGLVGRLLGHRCWRRLAAKKNSVSFAPTEPFFPGIPVTELPSRRHPVLWLLFFVLRVLFAALWAAVFSFVGLACSAFLAMGLGGGNQRLEADFTNRMAQEFALIIVFGPMGLAMLLSCLGILPGTRIGKR